MKIIFLVVVIAGCTGGDRPIPNVPRSTCPSAQIHEHAICSCGDFSQVGELTIKPGPAGVGSIGVNGATALVDRAEVAGTWIAWGGFSSVGGAVGDSLVTPGDAELVGDFTIGGDAVIGGDLDAVGTLAIDGRLELGGDENIVGDSAIAHRDTYVAPAAPPCGCDDSRFFDVAGAVSLAAEKLAPTPLDTRELHLATGSYYFAEPAFVGNSAIFIDGDVSVFVAGSLASVGSAQWKLADGARLALFVAGDVAFVGNVVAGDRARPEAVSLYIGGEQDTTLDVVGDARFYGSIYAPRVDVSYVGDTVIVGSIFAHEIDGVGTLAIEYGAPIEPPSSCRLDDPGITAPAFPLTPRA